MNNINSATTQMKINANVKDIWSKVGFYEHVQKKPTWLLRLSLPTPMEVEGHHDKVGDTCRCKYSDGGYLTKRITRIIDEHRIEFEVIEQSIRYQDTIKLLGGFIEIENNGNDGSIVKMTTYYDNRAGFNLVTNPFIKKGIKAMHRFVMRDMRNELAKFKHKPKTSCV